MNQKGTSELLQKPFQLHVIKSTFLWKQLFCSKTTCKAFSRRQFNHSQQQFSAKIQTKPLKTRWNILINLITCIWLKIAHLSPETWIIFSPIQCKHISINKMKNPRVFLSKGGKEKIQSPKICYSIKINLQETLRLKKYFFNGNRFPIHSEKPQGKYIKFK